MRGEEPAGQRPVGGREAQAVWGGGLSRGQGGQRLEPLVEQGEIGPGRDARCDAQRPRDRARQGMAARGGASW